MPPLGIVSAGSIECVEAAAHALRAGGNAADAAVAAGLATAAGSPSLTSLAGGGVLLHRDGATSAVSVLDFFAAAPGLGGRRGSGGETDSLPPLDFRRIAIDFQAGGTVQHFHIGRGATAMPGMLLGLLDAARRWGRLPLATLAAPASAFLRDGIRLSEFQVHCHHILGDILACSELGRRLFFDDAGELLAPGAPFRNPQLAAALEALVEAGPEAWLRDVWNPGLLAHAGEEAGGWLTADDLDAYRPVVRVPHTFRHAGARVYTNPAPSVGGRFVAHTLALFEKCALGDARGDPPEYYRRLAAALRAVAELRAEDPALGDRPDAAERLAERLRAILAAGAPGPTTPERSSPGNTVHISVIDAAGNAAALTSSHGEGNGDAIAGTGIFLNNFLGEEDLFPAGFFRFRAGERLRTMMAPTLIKTRSGEIVALGTGGSNRIRTALAQVIERLLASDASARDVVAEGRIHVEAGVLSAESPFLYGGPSALAQARALAATTREFERRSLFFGGVHVVLRRPDGSFEGAGDPRRGGVCRVVEAS